MMELDLKALGTVCGGKTLAERAVAGVQQCRAYNQRLGDQNFPYAPCVQEELRRYGRAKELYGPEGKGNGLMKRRHGDSSPVPDVYFLGEGE